VSEREELSLRFSGNVGKLTVASIFEALEKKICKIFISYGD
jgi:hypothetical protein